MGDKQITVSSIRDFRKWLQKHHTTEKRIAMVLYKRHTGKPTPKYMELLEEAICFGWIDTTIKRLDEDRYIRTFARRNKNSKWSDNTLSYAKKLLKEKRLTPEGLKFYKLGLKKPVHDDGIPKNPSMPEELQKTLAKSMKAKQGFDRFPPSTKKMLYRWLLSGKLPETRKKRIAKIISLAKEGKKSII